MLLKHPTVLDRLTREIRSEFSSSSDIVLTKTGDIEYLNAVIDETLRLFPPVPTTLPRVTPPQGHTILGQYVPPGTWVAVSQYASYRNDAYFTDPDEFVPERWLSDDNKPERYAGDFLKAVKPFSTGPRNCIGKHLAYAEMRTILAKILWNFDLSLVDGASEWMASLKVYGAWEKLPFMVRLKPRGQMGFVS